jgi:hypothetical protein
MIMLGGVKPWMIIGSDIAVFFEGSYSKCCAVSSMKMWRRKESSVVSSTVRFGLMNPLDFCRFQRFWLRDCERDV